jgi:hypothetical protein
MSKCRYCNGTGTQYVERGSSLCYDCPDCSGTGIVAICDRCDHEYDGEYCRDCYDVCSHCGVVVPIEELAFDGICEDCGIAIEDAIHILHDVSVSTHNISLEDLADICHEASYEVMQHRKDLYNAGIPIDLKVDSQDRYARNVYELAVSEQYNCQHYDTVQCGFCGERGITVDYLGTEKDSDGVFENWRAACKHCNKTSVDMNDPGSAIDIIVRGDEGEVVDAD